MRRVAGAISLDPDPRLPFMAKYVHPYSVNTPMSLPTALQPVPKGQSTNCSSDLTREMEPQPSSAAMGELVRLSRGCWLFGSSRGNKTPLTEPTRTPNELQATTAGFMPCAGRVVCHGPPWVSYIPIRPLSSAMRDDMFRCKLRACLPSHYGAMMRRRRHWPVDGSALH